VLLRDVPARWRQYFELTGEVAGTQADALDADSGNLGVSAGGSRGGSRGATQGANNGGTQGGYNLKGNPDPLGYGDSGGASRFFSVFRGDDDPPLPTFKYQAKAPMKERPSYVGPDGTKIAHATVKPVELLRWMIRLVTPPGGVILEPFAGSGTTAEAAVLEGFDCIAIEREEDYLPLIEQRMARIGVTATYIEAKPVETAPEPPIAEAVPAVVLEPAQLSLVPGSTVAEASANLAAAAPLSLMAPVEPPDPRTPWSKITPGTVVLGRGGLEWTVARIDVVTGRALVTVTRGNERKSFNVDAAARVVVVAAA
jgi:hypothetical protein